MGYKPVIVRAQPRGRVCETKGCSTLLSIYNKETVCAGCWRNIDIGTIRYPLTKGHRRVA